MKHAPISVGGDSATTYSEEDGKRYIGQHQEIQPTIDHVKHLRDVFATATKASNPNGWKHVGSVPISIIVDWCNRNKYTFDQWARDEDNAKKKFMKYFMSREFSKLHNQHVTTKEERSSIWMPGDPK